MVSFDSERTKFFTLIIGVMATGGYVGWMFQRAWMAGSLDNPVLLGLQNVGISQYDVAAAVAGGFLGLAVLMLFDRMKRGQGIILLSGIGTIISVFVITETVIPQWGVGSYIVLVGASTLAFFLNGGLRALTGDTDQFPRANIVVVATALLLVSAVFIEAHIHAESVSEVLLTAESTEEILNRLFDEAVYDEILIIPDLALAGSFVYLLYLFVGYEDGRSLATVGPSRAGKTHFLVGLYHLTDNRIGTVDEDDTLRDHRSTLLSTGEWLPETNQTGELWFKYIRGWLHKKERTISLHDYPGELFQFLPDGMRNEHSTERAAEAILETIRMQSIDVGELSDSAEDAADVATGSDEDSEEEVARKFASDLVDTNFASDVNNADTVIFVLDLKAFRDKVGTVDDWGVDEEDTDPWNRNDDPESTDGDETTANALHLDAYLSIQSDLDDDTQIVVVGTKSHVYAEEFVGVSPGQSYSQFRRLVTNKVKSHAQVEQLLNRSDNTDGEILPVYIEGDENGPDTGPSGQVTLTTVGFDKVMEEIS